MGLREFSSNRYPKLWKPLEHYFPDGLVNSDGERVTDLIEECVVRDIHQQPCHAHWVECPDREHQCFYMDRNNPVWREYLKAVIRIQVDAGVDGIQLDEAELPMGAFQYGACFCKDCMKGFRAHLQGLPADARDPLLDGVDLERFHYGEWLLERGHDFKEDRESSPLFGDYYVYQCLAIKKYFGELAAYARDYARSVGREVIVSGNFFNLEPMYLALADDVDLVITEMRNTTYRQPEWYRYVAAFAGDKDVVVVENPYGGVVPELIELLAVGKGHDLFRLSLLEAAAMGANMSVPYGSWMGSVIEDSFYAPHGLATEVQSFLADHEHLFARRTVNEVAVVFSVESTRELIGKADASDNTTNARDASVVVPYRVVTETLASNAVPFDVVIWADGRTAPDRATAEALQRYATVVLPDVHTMTAGQLAAIEGYLAGGGTVVVTDRAAGALSDHDRVTTAAPRRRGRPPAPGSPGGDDGACRSEPPAPRRRLCRPAPAELRLRRSVGRGATRARRAVARPARRDQGACDVGDDGRPSTRRSSCRTRTACTTCASSTSVSTVSSSFTTESSHEDRGPDGPADVRGPGDAASRHCVRTRSSCVSSPRASAPRSSRPGSGVPPPARSGHRGTR